MVVEAPPEVRRGYSIDEYLDRVYRWNVAEDRPLAIEQWFVTSAMVPLARRRARRLARERRPVRLHLGCGGNYLDGWVNLDLFHPRGRRDLVWDLRRGLPFPDGAVSCIASEHLFEHLALDAGVRLLRECHRVLSPGGVLRIGVPDLERYVAAYAGADPVIEAVRPGRPSAGLALAEVFYFYGHRAAYDFATLASLLHAAGFGTVERSASGAGRILPSPDSPRREAETLYVEAVK